MCLLLLASSEVNDYVVVGVEMQDSERIAQLGRKDKPLDMRCLPPVHTPG